MNIISRQRIIILVLILVIVALLIVIVVMVRAREGLDMDEKIARGRRTVARMERRQRSGRTSISEAANCAAVAFRDFNRVLDKLQKGGGHHD